MGAWRARWCSSQPPEPGELTPTPQEIDGPYFRLGAPQRSNLLEPGDKPELILSGRVLNQKGTPIPNAIVNLWSSDGAGNYDVVGHKYTGFVVTDAEGRYERGRRAQRERAITERRADHLAGACTNSKRPTARD